MARPPSKQPTDGELEILQVLWDRGPSTVRDVAEALDRTDAYTTVLKLLQIMTEKRLVQRRESGRLHIYTAASSRDQTQRHLVRDLIRDLIPSPVGDPVTGVSERAPSSRQPPDGGFRPGGGDRPTGSRGHGHATSRARPGAARRAPGRVRPGAGGSAGSFPGRPGGAQPADRGGGRIPARVCHRRRAMAGPGLGSDAGVRGV